MHIFAGNQTSWRMAFCATVATAMILVVSAATRAAAQSERKVAQAPPALPLPDECGFAALGDIRMWYAIFNNDAAGPSVLLIHGGLGMTENWGHQVPVLMKEYRVVVADTRGHGRSTRTKQPLGYATMTDDYVALLDHLKIDKVAVVGHSDGAIIGLDMAVRYPQRVRKLLAFAANFNVAGLKNDDFDPTQDPVLAPVLVSSRSEYERVSPTPTEYEAFRKELFAMWSSQPDFKPEQLAKIGAPTVVMGAEQDEFIRREHTEELARLIPGAKLVMLPDVGHLATLQDPLLFNREVLQFLNSSSVDSVAR